MNKILTIRSVYYALAGLFAVGVIWSAVGGYYMGAFIATVTGQIGAAIGIGITIFIAGCFGNWIWIAYIEDRRNQLLKEVVA